MRFVDKKLDFKNFLKARQESRKRDAFIRNFVDYANKHSQLYDSKYVSCFAFDGDTARIIVSGTPEREEFNCVFHYLEDRNLIRGIALDIGANYGIHSLTFARHYAKVLAFEPHPATFQALQFNVTYNNPRHNIQALNLGISDKSDTLDLYDYKDRNIGGSTFETCYVANPEIAAKFTCDVKTLDSVAEIRDAEIGLLKIDTEGHELSVLKGAKETIKKNMPVILLEDWLSRNGKESDSIKFLRECGYTNFLVPARSPSRPAGGGKVSKIVGAMRYAYSLMKDGQSYGLTECDFSAPKGYDLIVVHA